MKNPSPILRILNINDLNDALRLQECAVQELKDYYQPMDKKIIEAALSNQLSVGLFADDNMVGMRLCQIVDNRDLIHIKLSLAKDTRLLFLCGTYLIPTVRANKLGLKMTTACLDLAKNAGIEHVYTTVSPQNYPNLNNLLMGGFYIIDIGIQYSNKLRYTVYSNIQKKISLEKLELIHSIQIKNEDIQTQKKFIESGYVGVKTIKKQKELYTFYVEHIYL